MTGTRLQRLFVGLLIMALAVSCATYYRSNLKFNEVFERGDLKVALKTLQEKPSEGAGKKQFLYFVNNGLVLSLLGDYNESNRFFERAYLFGEDYRINYLNEAATYFSNPNFAVYRGEDHEHLMLLYYKAMNYLKLGKNEEALVECRRLNIRLLQLSDRYDSPEKYRKDAFIETLMGLIYEADLDYNNAFIAYRNALNSYEGEFYKLFQVSPPEQLKMDLVRTARLAGLDNEYETYRDRFGYPEPDSPHINRDRGVEGDHEGGEVVFFWHNGLSPVKTEWSVSFAISQSNGMVHFNNDRLGYSYSFSSEGYSQSQLRSLNSLDVYKLTLPKYVERPLYYASASLRFGEQQYPLVLLEDVNKVAFKCLDERMNLELSKALMRMAVKKASEHAASSGKGKDKWAGAVLQLMNVLTEAADTRNWQTLPHSISYARIALPSGQSTLTLDITDHDGIVRTQTFTYDLKPGQTHFHTFTSLESQQPGVSY